MDVDTEKKADATPTAEAQVNGEVFPPQLDDVQQINSISETEP